MSLGEMCQDFLWQHETLDLNMMVFHDVKNILTSKLNVTPDIFSYCILDIFIHLFLQHFITGCCLVSSDAFFFLTLDVHEAQNPFV